MQQTTEHEAARVCGVWRHRERKRAGFQVARERARGRCLVQVKPGPGRKIVVTRIEGVDRAGGINEPSGRGGGFELKKERWNRDRLSVTVGVPQRKDCDDPEMDGWRCFGAKESVHHTREPGQFRFHSKASRMCVDAQKMCKASSRQGLQEVDRKNSWEETKEVFGWSSRGKDGDASNPEAREHKQAVTMERMDEDSGTSPSQSLSSAGTGANDGKRKVRAEHPEDAEREHEEPSVAEGTTRKTRRHVEGKPRAPEETRSGKRNMAFGAGGG